MPQWEGNTVMLLLQLLTLSRDADAINEFCLADGGDWFGFGTNLSRSIPKWYDVLQV